MIFFRDVCCSCECRFKVNYLSSRELKESEGNTVNETRPRTKDIIYWNKVRVKSVYLHKMLAIIILYVSILW